MNHVYVTGVDGCGKTTQLDRLQAKLEHGGERVHRVWIRFPAIASAPLLLYARIRGLTWYKVHGGVRTGAWDFARSALLRSCLPWLQLFDLVLLNTMMVLPAIMKGKRILYERHALDVLADLVSATGRTDLHEAPVGRAILSCVAPSTTIIVLDVDWKMATERRTDLKHDPMLRRRVEAYRIFVSSGLAIRVDANEHVDVVSRAIQTELSLRSHAGSECER